MGRLLRTQGDIGAFQVIGIVGGQIVYRTALLGIPVIDDLVAFLGYIRSTVTVGIQTPDGVDRDVAALEGHFGHQPRQLRPIILGVDLVLCIRQAPAHEQNILAVLLIVGRLVGSVQRDLAAAQVGVAVGGGIAAAVGIIGQGVGSLLHVRGAVAIGVVAPCGVDGFVLVTHGDLVNGGRRGITLAVDLRGGALRPADEHDLGVVHIAVGRLLRTQGDLGAAFIFITISRHILDRPLCLRVTVIGQAMGHHRRSIRICNRIVLVASAARVSDALDREIFGCRVLRHCNRCCHRGI